MDEPTDKTAMLEQLASELRDEHVYWLMYLGPDVIDRLVASAADGVRRPGSWERQWLFAAFGDEFVRRIEKAIELGHVVLNQWGQLERARRLV